MKRIISVMLVIVVCLGCVPHASALSDYKLSSLKFSSYASSCLHEKTPYSDKVKENVVVYLDSEDEIDSFYKSSEYDPSLRYTFVYPSEEQTRILCPKCKYNTYRGKSMMVEDYIMFKACPTGNSIGSDELTRYLTYTYSECWTCGYRTPYYWQETKWRVDCHLLELTGYFYWAKPGQTIQQGYDVHECYSSWPGIF